jgi:CheY-like chemotaxis protein
VAHDFNNLLTVILGYGGVVAECVKNGDEFANMSIQEVLKAGERASALTQRLLAFSRKQILQPEILNANEVVSGMEGMLKRIIGEDVEIRVELDGSVGLILADYHQIEQVIMNLCVNARDAMPGGGRLTISTRDLEVDGVRGGLPVRTPGRYSVLSVTDTGSGMDAETQARIFEPFFTTKGAGKGTGLGLSMVYGIVEQSGGAIRLESAPGKGSTFEIYLPCADNAEQTTQAKESPVDSRGTECVLLVEDEAAVRQLTESMLKQAGYSVVAVESGEEALRLPESVLSTIDLVVTDVVMPGISGPKLAEALLAKRPNVPVLYVSGYADHPILAEGEAPDHAALLQKPFKRQELLSKVRSSLAERSRTSSATC